ncbi:MAG: TIM44-like domain-containing protein [Burkholderiaceae bacterium]|nr:TIM44-like domain-containing protein [Burkholderiaceae bacterium]
MKLWSAILICALAFSGLNAEAARRMGGGGSIGKQSSNVTQRSSAAPAGSTQNATNSVAKPAAAAPAAAPVAPKKPWGAMLGGLAAGLGLAYLMNSMGLGGLAGGIGQFIMFAILAFGIMVAVGMFMRSRAKKAEGNSANGSGSSPFAFQGAGQGSPSAADAVTPRQYSPLNVGNDASARPWEGNATAFDSSKSMIGSGLQTPALGGDSALSGSQSWGVPADFDTAGFLTAAKRNFVTLQDAWDKSDIAALRAMMTDDMAGEIKSQLAERAGHTGAGANKTDVVMLDAQLLGIEEMTDGYMASVEFSGMIREEPSSGPAPFREVWNMTKAKSSGSGWLVAGVQALQ